MASQDIGSLGPGQSEPVQVTCNWLAGLPRLLPWIILGLLLIWRGRRDRRAWAVLVPLVVIYLIWSIARQILPFDAPVLNLLSQGLADFSAALAVLWLTIDALSRDPGWVAFPLSLLVTLGVAVLAPLGEAPAAEADETISRVLCVAVAALAACGSLMLAGACSRRAALDGRFFAWLLLWLLLLTVSGVLVTAATMILIEDHSLRWFFRQFGDILLAGLVVSAAVCTVVLPFVILSTQSSFHRRRLEAYLGIKLGREQSPGDATS